MRFKFEGREFQISFAHDKPRDWSAHADHVVEIKPGGVLYCERCNLQLSHLSKRDRVRRTRCEISLNHGLEGVATGETIIASAYGTPHGGNAGCPGDAFTREGGRRASLANALATIAPGPGISLWIGPWPSRAFRAAAWAAYEGRATKERAA